MKHNLDANTPRLGRSWHTLPLSHNLKAARPLYTVLFGFWCWQLTALFWGAMDSSWGFSLFGAAVILGTGCLLAGFLVSFVYRHSRVSAFTLLVSLFSLPFCFLLVCFLWGGYCVPSFAGWYLQHHPVFLWLCLQAIWLILALWRSRWRRRVKAGLTAGAAFALISFFGGLTAQAKREEAAAPHVTSSYLASIYAKNDRAAIKRMEQKRIVATGSVWGEGEGIIGWGGPDRMESNIMFDDSVGSQSLNDGQVVSIIGTCGGKDAYGNISLNDSRVIR